MRLNYRPHGSSSNPDRNKKAAGTRAVEEKFRSIFEASPDYIIVARLDDGKIVEANEGFERLCGWSRQEAVGRTVLDLGLWAQPAQRQELVKLLRREGVARAFPIDFRHRDGRILHVLAAIRVFELAGETMYVAILRDITEEERVRRALKASETRLRTIFDNAPYAIVLHRASDMTYMEINPAYERMFGYSEDEVIGKTVAQVGFVILDRAGFREQTRALLATGRADDQEATVQRRDGRWVTFRYSTRKVELEGEEVFITVTLDVSQQKAVEEGMRQTEEALRESEARFITLFEASPIAFGVFHDAKYNYAAVQFNEAWYKTFRYQPDDVVGKPTTGFKFQVNPGDRPRMLELLESDGEANAFECWLRCADGEEILCAVTARKLVVGDHWLVLAAYVDITRQRQAEADLQQLNVTLENRVQERSQALQKAQAELMRSEKLAALGSLVAGVAHELNTPIGNSLMVASTLVEETGDIRDQLAKGIRRAALENYLAAAANGGNLLVRNLGRAAELIQSFKNVAVDQASDQRREFELGTVVTETLEVLGRPKVNHGVVIAADLEPGLRMNSYPGSLEQVLINLINNALLHAFEGRPEGTIRIGARAVDEEQIELTVSDDGIGIPPENLSRVFDPFFTTRLGKGGSGLGLSIVSSLVENVLGGRISVSSQPGLGTQFRIRIPLIAPERAAGS